MSVGGAAAWATTYLVVLLAVALPRLCRAGGGGDAIGQLVRADQLPPPPQLRGATSAPRRLVDGLDFRIVVQSGEKPWEATWDNVAYGSDQGLLIGSVEPGGTLAVWNAANPSEQVLPGDVIKAVERLEPSPRTAETAEEMKALLNEPGKLAIALVRDAERISPVIVKVVKVWDQPLGLDWTFGDDRLIITGVDAGSVFEVAWEQASGEDDTPLKHTIVRVCRTDPGEKDDGTSNAKMEELLLSEGNLELAIETPPGGAVDFHCLPALNNIPDRWVPEKRDWCCANEHQGCGNDHSTDDLFDCEAGKSEWTRQWSDPKKRWCCANRQTGCEGDGAVTTFDCSAGLDNKESGWSEAKKEWCCSNEQVGCSESPPELFDCGVGVDNMDGGWSDEKKAWCCSNKQVGCAEPTSGPFDCSAGLDNWRQGWADDKKAWCCSNEQVACSSEPFDCSHGFHNWQHSWADDKKAWCCSNKQVGCGEEPSSEPFDCSAGLDNWATGWADDKKAWCCSNKQVGCANEHSSEPFDCSAGLDNWAAGWADDKKAWCCSNKQVGCAEEPSSEPFDCSSGLDNWRQGWADDKKAWCCSNKQVACSDAYDCAEGHDSWATGWTDAKKSWCCSNKQVGCVESTKEEFDCSTGVDNLEDGWSDDKKAWCCSNKQVGCVESTDEEFDCSAGVDNLEDGWSEDKKRWCCQNKKIRCPPAERFDCAAGVDNFATRWSADRKEWCCTSKQVACEEEPEAQEGAVYVALTTRTEGADAVTKVGWALDTIVDKIKSLYGYTDVQLHRKEVKADVKHFPVKVEATFDLRATCSRSCPGGRPPKLTTDEAFTKQLNKAIHAVNSDVSVTKARLCVPGKDCLLKQDSLPGWLVGLVLLSLAAMIVFLCILIWICCTVKQEDNEESNEPRPSEPEAPFIPPIPEPSPPEPVIDVKSNNLHWLLGLNPEGWPLPEEGAPRTVWDAELPEEERKYLLDNLGIASVPSDTDVVAVSVPTDTDGAIAVAPLPGVVPLQPEGVPLVYVEPESAPVPPPAVVMLPDRPEVDGGMPPSSSGAFLPPEARPMPTVVASDWPQPHRMQGMAVNMKPAAAGGDWLPEQVEDPGFKPTAGGMFLEPER